MRGNPPVPPTLAGLRSVLPEYGRLPFDRTLEAARRDIGGIPDLANPEHARRLRLGLNQWLCRIGYPAGGQEDVFAASLAKWWLDFEATLPPARMRPAELEAAGLKAVSDAYGDLDKRQAAVSRTSPVGRDYGGSEAAVLRTAVRRHRLG
jgi:hypothetical protein